MNYNTQDSPFHKLEQLNFSLDVWLNFWYPAICNYLAIDAQADLEAVKLAKKYKSNVKLIELQKMLETKKVILVAPGTILEKQRRDMVIEKIKENLQKKIVISIDGATTFFAEHNIIPDIVVSDLDGKVDDQLMVQQEGSIMLVHIHGDNITAVKKYLPKISTEKFMLTTQTEPTNYIHNFYGFTDGDRGVALCKYFNSKEVTLIGYDFGDKIGVYSKTLKENKMIQRKMKKFIIAKSVINWCQNNGLKITYRYR